MTYEYQCSDHIIEVERRCGEASPTIFCCEHNLRACGRYYGSIAVINDDAFRRAWLSSKMQHALIDQKRPLDPLAPKDKFEKKHIEKITNRIYIGDDVSQLSTKAQKAIAHGKGRPG